MKQKSILIFTSFLFFLSTPSTQAQDFQDASSYMEFMGNEYHAISKDLWRYISASAHGKRAKKVEKRRMELIATTQEAQRKISRMPAFEGDASLRDSVSSYLKLSYIMLNEDFAKIVDMEAIAEQSYDHMEAYLLAKEKANEKLDKAGERLNEEQTLFAEKHHINLTGEKSKLTLKLENAGEVMAYYHKLYLIFFKSYKQESYLLEALETGDINALEQNKNALIHFSEEGLQRLDTIPRFRGDATLKIACLQMMNFYKMEAEQKFPLLIDFYLKKENFEKLKAAFDAKKQSELTKEDIDTFNEAVNEYNQAITQFNSTNDQLNKLRGKVLDNWNNTVDKFIDKQTPKYR
jgi:hypothetical protein